jgi:hypothetical protein
VTGSFVAASPASRRDGTDTRNCVSHGVLAVDMIDNNTHKESLLELCVDAGVAAAGMAVLRFFGCWGVPNQEKRHPENDPLGVDFKPKHKNSHLPW